MVSLVTIFVLSLQAISASANPHAIVCPVRKHQEVVMKIHFVRSGGFGGAAMRVEGDVVFDDHGGRVISAKTGYERQLEPAEVEILRCAVQPSTASKSKEPKAGGVPDGYQYDISTVAEDGKVHPVTSLNDPGGRTPEENDLFKWVQEESERIWQYRINKR
jgi:hypothetical protein